MQTTKTLSDGSRWERVLHHNNPASYKFPSSSAGNFDNGSNLISYLYLLTTDNFYNPDTGYYEFLVEQKAESSDSVTSYRWKQTNAAASTSTVTGYVSVSNGPGGGICKCNGNTYLAATNTTSNWWRACGSWTGYNGGIPGFGNVIVKSGYLDLWVRIDGTRSIICTTSRLKTMTTNAGWTDFHDKSAPKNAAGSPNYCPRRDEISADSTDYSPHAIISGTYANNQLVCEKDISFPSATVTITGVSTSVGKYLISAGISESSPYVWPSITLTFSDGTSVTRTMTGSGYSGTGISRVSWGTIAISNTSMWTKNQYSPSDEIRAVNSLGIIPFNPATYDVAIDYGGSRYFRVDTTGVYVQCTISDGRIYTIYFEMYRQQNLFINAEFTISCNSNGINYPIDWHAHLYDNGGVWNPGYSSSQMREPLDVHATESLVLYVSKINMTSGEYKYENESGDLSAPDNTMSVEASHYIYVHYGIKFSGLSITSDYNGHRICTIHFGNETFTSDYSYNMTGGYPTVLGDYQYCAIGTDGKIWTGVNSENRSRIIGFWAGAWQGSSFTIYFKDGSNTVTVGTINTLQVSTKLRQLGNGGEY